MIDRRTTEPAARCRGEHVTRRGGAMNGKGNARSKDTLLTIGPSVCPMAGQVNLTMTVLALALLLAEHLKGL